jgi:hypothetical protein
MIRQYKKNIDHLKSQNEYLTNRIDEYREKIE